MISNGYIRVHRHFCSLCEQFVSKHSLKHAMLWSRLNKLWYCFWKVQYIRAGMKLMQATGPIYGLSENSGAWLACKQNIVWFTVVVRQHLNQARAKDDKLRERSELWFEFGRIPQQQAS